MAAPFRDLVALGSAKGKHYFEPLIRLSEEIIGLIWQNLNIRLQKSKSNLVLNSSVDVETGGSRLERRYSQLILLHNSGRIEKMMESVVNPSRQWSNYKL